MSARQTITIAVAALVLIGGAAAVGAASPAEAANETAVNTYDEVDDHGSDSAHPATNASDLQAANAGSVGPSDGLPSQAADHVSDVHERINAFLDGALDNLGHSLSELLTGE